MAFYSGGSQTQSLCSLQHFLLLPMTQQDVLPDSFVISAEGCLRKPHWPMGKGGSAWVGCQVHGVSASLHPLANELSTYNNLVVWKRAHWLMHQSKKYHLQVQHPPIWLTTGADQVWRTSEHFPRQGKGPPGFCTWPPYTSEHLPSMIGKHFWSCPGGPFCVFHRSQYLWKLVSAGVLELVSAEGPRVTRKDPTRIVRVQCIELV